MTNMSTRATATWNLASAKARFSEVISRAESKGPQIVTRHGRKVAVIVSAEEWERDKVRKGTLADFFARSPLRGSGIKIERLKGLLREVDL
jgi:prevent-host-death family protein